MGFVIKSNYFFHDKKNTLLEQSVFRISVYKKLRFLDSSLEFRTCLESNNFHSWDLDLLLWILWINTFSSFSVWSLESTETLDSNFTLFFNTCDDSIDESVYQFCSQLLRYTKFVSQMSDKSSLCHYVHKLSYKNVPHHSRKLPAFCKRTASPTVSFCLLYKQKRKSSSQAGFLKLPQVRTANKSWQ
jgi:hypothetical protein